jgi:hypothetical protein
MPLKVYQFTSPRPAAIKSQCEFGIIRAVGTDYLRPAVQTLERKIVMEMIAVLIGLLVFGVPIWLIVRAVSTRNRIEELSRRLNDLELEFIRRKRDASRASGQSCY